MSAGYGYAGVCYPDIGTAGKAWATTVGPRFHHDGQNSHVVVASYDGDSTDGRIEIWPFGCDLYGEGCSGPSMTVVPEFYECIAVTGSDALDMSWLVVAAWAAIFAVKILRRGLP